MKVTDGVSGSSTGGFTNGSSGTSNDYTYDDNGNMTSDLNKGITEILYNHLNLPEHIYFGNNGSIEYLYNAAGQKLKKTVHDTPNNTIKHVDYLDGFQYAGDKLQFFPTSEGYVSATQDGISIGNPDLYIFNYVYNYTDHLGNIRLSYTKDPVSNQLKIMEENHYYPFGLKHGVYADPKQKYELVKGLPGEEGNTARPTYVLRTDYQYKYQGQERQDELGLNWDSFKWRNYDGAIARFMSVDPLAEDYPHNGVYNFSENRVLDGVELEGLEWFGIIAGNSSIPPPNSTVTALAETSVKIGEVGIKVSETTIKVGETAVKTNEHHIIPRQFRNSEVVQEAKQQGFKFEGKENKITVEQYSKSSGNGRHGNHPNYNQQVKEQLTKIGETFPKSESVKAVRGLVENIKENIKANPETKINDLTLKNQLGPAIKMDGGIQAAKEQQLKQPNLTEKLKK